MGESQPGESQYYTNEEVIAIAEEAGGGDGGRAGEILVAAETMGQYNKNPELVGEKNRKRALKTLRGTGIDPSRMEPH